MTASSSFINAFPGETKFSMDKNPGDSELGGECEGEQARAGQSLSAE
jgi:hypothetical protein